jgi:hypothetical protein
MALTIPRSTPPLCKSHLFFNPQLEVAETFELTKYFPNSFET